MNPVIPVSTSEVPPGWTIVQAKCSNTFHGPAGHHHLPGRAWVSSLKAALARRPELPLFGLVVVLLNWPVLTGTFMETLVFRPEAVRAGEWWRLFTHAFVHVTWYHLLLDGAAFLLLVESLSEARLLRRMSYILFAIAGSLLASWWAAPEIAVSGLCGLSGVAHGLMAISAVEMISHENAGSAEARCGWITLGLVVGKAALEALSGGMFFSFLHFGRMGAPVAVSHAGGVIGALAAMLWFSSRSKDDRCNNRPC